jgi:hypothetical protein
VAYSIAKAAALVDDRIAKSGYREFPFTSFRLNNLTIDDLDDASLTKQFRGDLHHTVESAAKATADRLFGAKGKCLRGA